MTWDQRVRYFNIKRRIKVSASLSPIKSDKYEWFHEFTVFKIYIKKNSPMVDGVWIVFLNIEIGIYWVTNQHIQKATK